MARSGRRRPSVLAAVTAGQDAAATLFEMMAAVSEGADGIDLDLPVEVGPAERLSLADQLADASGADLYLRSSLPMAAGRHRVIRSADDARPGRALFDIGLDLLGQTPSEAVADWQRVDDDRSLLLSTVGFGTDDSSRTLSSRTLSDAALMGLATFACVAGLDAVSTDRVRIVRRVVDTLAPVMEEAAACR